MVMVVMVVVVVEVVVVVVMVVVVEGGHPKPDPSPETNTRSGAWTITWSGGSSLLSIIIMLVIYPKIDLINIYISIYPYISICSFD